MIAGYRTTHVSHVFPEILTRPMGRWRLALFDFRSGGGPDVDDDEETVFWAHASDLDLNRFLSLPKATRVGVPLSWYASSYNLPADYTVDHFAGLPVTLPDSPALTRSRFLCAEDPESLCERLGDALVRLCRESPDLCVEAGGPDLIVYRRKRRLGPKQSRALYQSGLGLLRTLDRALSTGAGIERPAGQVDSQPLRYDPAAFSRSN